MHIYVLWFNFIPSVLQVLEISVGEISSIKVTVYYFYYDANFAIPFPLLTLIHPMGTAVTDADTVEESEMRDK